MMIPEIHFGNVTSHSHSPVVVPQYALEDSAAQPRAADRTDHARATPPPGFVVSHEYPVSVAHCLPFSGVGPPSNAHEPVGSEMFKLVVRRLEHLEPIPALASSPRSDRPPKISAWIRLILTTADNGVSIWWTWTVTVARPTHSRYLA